MSEKTKFRAGFPKVAEQFAAMGDGQWVFAETRRPPAFGKKCIGKKGWQRKHIKSVASYILF
jgi:hypothetical protein